MAKGKGKMKGKKRQYKKRQYRKKVTNVADYAGRSEVLDIPNPNPLPPPLPPTLLVANTVYNFRNFTLDQFAAAVQIARAYQFYRIKRVTFKFMPLADTFVAAAGNSVPQLYYMIDKSGSIPTNATLDSLKKMGAKPVRFDDKTITRGFAPSVLTVDTAAPGVFQSSQYRVSPWLSTNANALNPGAWVPSTIDHLGMFWCVQQEVFPVNQQVSYRCELTIEFQFKKPLWTDVAQAEAPQESVAIVLPHYKGNLPEIATV